MSHLLPPDTLPAKGLSSVVAHPFYPVALDLPTYVENKLHPIILLAVFFSLLGLWITYAVKHATATTKGRITTDEKWWVAWFAACGIIHITFEGYFAVFHKTMIASSYIEAEMWKMYSLSDSRYINSDPFTVLMEGCTAFLWGPMCMALAFYLIPRQSTFRHPVQFCASLGQWYGLVLYYGIVMLDEIWNGPIKAVSRPEAIYYWGEFIGLNAPWFFIPAFAIYKSVFAISDAFRIAATSPIVKSKSNGHVTNGNAVASLDASAAAEVDAQARAEKVPFIPSIVHDKEI